jgi:hypothetical protein
MQNFIQWGNWTPEQQAARQAQQRRELEDWALMKAVNEARAQAAGPIAAGRGGHEIPTWATTGNTVYLYPEVEFAAAEAAWTGPLIKEGNVYLFESLVDINQFYYQIWYQTFLTLPKPGNPETGGYSVGVPSNLTGSFNERQFRLIEGYRLVTILQELTLVTPQSSLPLANQGDAPDGQVGWATVWIDIDLNYVPDPVNPGMNPAPYGDIDTLRLVRTN